MKNLIFHEETHTYKLGGIILPSVTQICKPLTADIAENAKPWLRDAAAVRGSKIHEICAEIDMQGDTEGICIPPELNGYIKAYTAFLRDYQIKSWLAVEKIVYSEELGVAGTIDRIGEIDEKITIIDIKSGTSIDKALLTAQLGGYVCLMNAVDCNFRIHDIVWNTWVLQLKKDGNYRIIKCSASVLFYTLLTLHKERERINNAK